MNNRVQQLLADEGENYILPFFWQHGEDEAVLREYMGAIQNANIRAVCVEARPHPDFAGPQWWHDMDIIMDEARTRHMRVWILDDAHFPTGFANGKLADADPTLCKQYAAVSTTDVFGPTPCVEVDITSMAHYRPSPFGGGGGFPGMMRSTPRTFDDDKLLCVIASRLVDGNKVDATLVDLTAGVVEGKLAWDVPAGAWRIYVIYNTHNGGGRSDYINVIDEASCRVQIDAVYEPHYAHYKDDFGKTLAGFFSDEPLFGNTFGFNFDELIGRKTMPLPWNQDVPRMLAESLGADWPRLLPALWTEAGDPALTARVRYAYMDVVTRLVRQNFSNQLGRWCAAHGVEYIGHIIEDSNQHARLGCSLGHFFRALDGQHMAGIDDIGGQVLPGGENHTRRIDGDGEFFHFALGKLGSSHGHIDPKKQGRAMCEIYGAYGWGETIATMKWLTDHFVVRGINHYVPHAFSPKAFPDRDCPPHFYAHGLNPQYRHFGYLMRYLNRLCHLFNGGLHVAPVALLYHGEAEWSGQAMLLQKPARQLLEAQIDFDILPPDVFATMNQFNASFDGELHVNGETYRALVVPYGQFVTAAVAEFACRARAAGFEVVFVDGLPEGICDAANPPEAAALLNGLQGCTVQPLQAITSYLRGQGIYDITASAPFKGLRYYHYRQDGGDIFMFFNEDVAETFDGMIDVPTAGPAVIYDALANVLRPVSAEPALCGTRLHLWLEPYQSAVVVFGDYAGELKPAPSPEGKKTVLDGAWDFSVARATEYPHFHDQQTLHKLENVGSFLPDFSGFMRYEQQFVLGDCRRVCLEIEHAYDGVEVWVNDQYAGMAICPPYRFDLSGLIHAGTNTLRIEVANTLDREARTLPDGSPFAMFGFGSNALGPSGIVGQVALYTA
jgi:hypothetical protein